MQIGVNLYVCAKKEYHFSPKIGSNYAILVAVFIVGTVYVYDLFVWWHGV